VHSITWKQNYTSEKLTVDGIASQT